VLILYRRRRKMSRIFNRISRFPGQEGDASYETTGRDITRMWEPAAKRQIRTPPSCDEARIITAAAR